MYRPAVLAAGNAGHLLRRRDRHGRQHLPGRSRRRAHADAVVGRSQRGLQPGQSADDSICRSSSIPEYHYETVNVEAQHGNPSSLLWWVKRLITLRKSFRSFGRGSFRLLRPENTKVLAFIREYEDERVLVVANLSRFVQYVQLDLKDYAGCIPEEVLGRTRFPRVTDQPYLLTLGPHGFIWFALPLPEPSSEAPRKHAASAGNRSCRSCAAREPLAKLVPARATGGNRGTRCPTTFAATDCPPSPRQRLVVRDRSRRPDPGRRDRGVVPDRCASTPAADRRDVSHGPRLRARSRAGTVAGAARDGGIRPDCRAPSRASLCDALAVPACCRGLLRGILGGRSRQVEDGEIEAVPLSAAGAADRPRRSRISRSSLHRSQRPKHVGHLRRILHLQDVLPGRGRRQSRSRDRPLSRTSRQTITDLRRLSATSNTVVAGPSPITLGVLHRYVPNQGTAWQFTLDQLSQYFERVAALPRDAGPAQLPHRSRIERPSRTTRRSSPLPRADRRISGQCRAPGPAHGRAAPCARRETGPTLPSRRSRSAGSTSGLSTSRCAT